MFVSVDGSSLLNFIWNIADIFIVKKNIFKAQVGKELEEEMLKLYVNPCVEDPREKMTPEQQVTG